MSGTKATIDHEKIKQWAEERGGRPAAVDGTGNGDDPGILRIDFPDYTGEETLREISWEQFFDKFEREGLAFLYQDETSEGERSRFSKLTAWEPADQTAMGRQMNPFEFLKKDHQKVARILEQLSDTSRRASKTRDELFAKLYSELDIHSRMEEQAFYPVLRLIEETRQIANEAIEEHGVVKRLLEEMDTAEKLTEEWTAKLAVLKESVEHHVEEEEGEMFKKAKKALSRDQINELGNRLLASKRELSASSNA
jgi:hypothetical protein